MKSVLYLDEEASTVAWFFSILVLLIKKRDSSAFLIARIDIWYNAIKIQQGRILAIWQTEKVRKIIWNKFFSEPKYLWKDMNLNYNGCSSKTSCVYIHLYQSALFLTSYLEVV